MYEVIRNVIQSGNLNLNDLLVKIDTQWLQGRITDEQRIELIDEARSKAGIEKKSSILNKIAELEKRIYALEHGGAAGEKYPPYVEGMWYSGGDRVTFEGIRFVCVAASGTVCTSSPVEYPEFWAEV